MSERFNEPPEADPLSLNDFLYYYKPLLEPPWYDDDSDTPEPLDYFSTYLSFDPLQVVPNNRPVQYDPMQFNFSDMDFVMESKSPVDNFHYCCSFS